jgi:hypothetical protein
MNTNKIIIIIIIILKSDVTRICSLVWGLKPENWYKGQIISSNECIFIITINLFNEFSEEYIETQTNRSQNFIKSLCQQICSQLFLSLWGLSRFCS